MTTILSKNGPKGQEVPSPKPRRKRSKRARKPVRRPRRLPQNGTLDAAQDAALVASVDPGGSLLEDVLRRVVGDGPQALRAVTRAEAMKSLRRLETRRIVEVRATGAMLRVYLLGRSQRQVAA